MPLVLTNLPGLREWGSGLEALAECYFKYVEGCLVEVGRTFQRKLRIKHPKAKAGGMLVPYPYDIDLIAVRPDQKKVLLVSCSEKWTKTVKKTLDEFTHYEDFVKNSPELGYGRNVVVERKIVCVKMSKGKKQNFLRNNIAVLDAESMVDALLNLVRKPRAQKRKGVHLEPLLWLLQTLDGMGKIQ